MAKKNNRVKRVVDVKGEEPNKPAGVQVIPGNTQTLIVQLLAEILKTLKGMADGGQK